jgi:hypothetical protein
MHSTDSISCSITGKQGNHGMYWLATIMTSICLCTILSGCFTASTAPDQTTRATIPNNTAAGHKLENSPVVRETVSSKALNGTTTTQKTAATSTRVLNGTATIWTDSSLFPGPAAQTISITSHINNSTGAVTASFAPFGLTDPSTGRTITVSLPPGTTATGQFNASTGSLTLTSPLLLQNVPVAGTVTTKAITLATNNTITIPSGTQYSGQPLNASNNITLVGNTSFKVAFVSANAQMRITGVLESAG